MTAIISGIIHSPLFSRCRIINTFRCNMIHVTVFRVKSIPIQYLYTDRHVVFIINYFNEYFNTSLGICLLFLFHLF